MLTKRDVTAFFFGVALVLSFETSFFYLRSAELPSALLARLIAMHTPEATYAASGLRITHATSSMWFLGDVMLSRQVGAIAAEKGSDWPWQRLTDIFNGAYVVANFEACVSETSRFRWSERMRFMVEPAMLPAMREAGVTHASLANNHAYDCGRGGVEETKRLLDKAAIAAFGHPTLTDESAVLYQDLGDYTLALVGLHTVYTELDDAAAAELIADASKKSDLQIAYIHWGEEYRDVATKEQQAQAKMLIDSGADIVIGHHPHVVQNIDRYGNGLIIFSLGNFIFDQYFSHEVQEGLGLTLSLTSRPHIALVPFTSRDSRTQPRLMTDNEKERFLLNLSKKSHEDLRDEIVEGTIDLSPYLQLREKRL